MCDRGTSISASPLPQYPLYFEAQDKNQPSAMLDLSEEQEKARRQDWEVISSMRDYQKRYHDEWRNAARTYNVVQDGSLDNRVSNIYIGLARMIIDTGISMMTEGEPDFDFAPLGPSDYKKVLLWKAALKMVMSQCNYRSHQASFITDFMVYGTGAFEVYTQLPFRKKRYEKLDGTMEEKIVRDFRRPKVGVRHISPFLCSRSPNVSDPDDVPVSEKRETLTYNQAVQNYGNVITPDGKPKYDQKVLKQLFAMRPSHFQLTHLFDEIGDVFRIYMCPFGSQVEGQPVSVPEELGAPIFDKSLSINRIAYLNGSQKEIRSSGSNVLGMTPLCFGINNDQYDHNLKTHAIYGMGIPRMIEGPEMAFEAMFNMTLDNLRLQNTVTLSYKGNNFPDLDNMSFYSGMFLDGEVVATPWGQARLGDNSMFWEWLNNLCVWLTGINFQQLVGDTSKTAFEFAQRIRANNQRAESRLRGLENGCLKRMATLLLSNILSEMTVEEWEDLTEEQAKAIVKRIESGDELASDYGEYVDGKPTKRRVMGYIQVPDGKLKEDFTAGKTRKADYGSTENTLVSNPKPAGPTYIPMVGEYLYPTEYIEYGLLPDVIVDGKRMLGDMKAQDIDMWKQYGDYLRGRLQESVNMPDQMPNVDMKKYDAEFARFIGIEDGRIMKEETTGSDIQDAFKEVIESLDSPPPNAQPSGPIPPAVPSAQGLGPANQPPSVPEPSNALTDTAQGTL